MTAGFFKRLFSTVIDFVIIMVVVYFAFTIGGETILQNRVDYFDAQYYTYQEILAAYNDDLTEIQTDYQAAMTIAEGDAELEAAALAEYNLKSILLNTQNTIDIQPYNISLSSYFLEILYFFAFGFIVLMTILTLITLGKTPGRRLFRLRLVHEITKGEIKNPTIIQIFFHDIMLKYFLIVLLFMYNPIYGAMFILIAIVTDLILITITRNKATIRDYFLRMKVIPANYGN